VPDTGEGYRLQTLLELRMREEDERKGQLAQAVEQAARAREALAAARARRVDAIRAHDARVERGEASIGDLDQARRWLDRLADAVTVAAAAAGAAEAAETAAREALAGAARERQAIEKHREGWLAGEKRARERREDQALDELANRRQDK
jgi:flagellar export protein FliJ